MANRDIVYGIRITANSASAVAETQKVDKAFGEVGAALGKVVVEAEKAESSLSAVVSPAAQAGLQAEASALGSVAEKLDQVAVGAGKAEASLVGVTSKPLQGVQAGSAALGATAEKLNQVAVGAAKADAALSAVATKSVQAASPAAAASLGVTAGQIDRVGISAAQTAQALHQLPMQFSDIVVSLQAGQSPMQVLLQQGSQIKDQFGGIGPAAQAMGGYIAGLVGPFTIAAGAVAGLALAYYQGSEESTRFATGLILTGNVVGKTVGQLSDMAKEVSAATRATQAFAADALSQVVSTGAIAAENIGMVAEAAVRMERATGQSIGETIKQFVELGKEPVKASEKLNETANYLTADLYKQIRALAEHGKSSEASALAQKGWADALNERTAEITQNLGYIEAAWRGVIDTAKAGWDAILGVGRTQSKTERIAELEQKAAPGRGIFAGMSADEKAELAGLKAAVAEEQKAAKAAADRAASTSATVTWLKEGDKYLSRSEQREQAIAKVRQDGAAAGASQVEIEKRIASIREKYKEPTERKAAKSAGESIEKDWVRRLAVLQAEAGATTQLTETEKAAVKVMTEFAQGKLKLTAAEKARLPGLVQEALLLDDAAEAAKKAKVEQEALAKAQEAAIAAVRADTQTLLAKLDAAQFEAATYGMTEEAVYRLLAARAADRAEMNAFGDANDAVIAELKAQEKAYLELADAAGAKASREAVRKAGDDARASAQRFSDDLERALTDSLMRSFEAGKGFGEAFLGSIKNMLKTAALKAVVQVIAQPVTSSFAGSFAGGSGVSAGGSGGVGNLLSIGNSAAGMSSLSAYTGAAGYMQLGSMASSFGTALSAAGAGADLSAAIAAYEAAGMGATASSLSAGASVAGSIGGGAASALGSVMSGLATAAPYLAVAMLVAQQLGAFKGPTYHHGGAYMASTDGTLTKANNANLTDFNLGWGAYTVDRSSGFDDAMLAMSQGVAKQIEESIKAFGGKTGSLTVGARFASDNDDWSEGAIRIVNEAGDRVYDFTKRYTSDSGKALQQFGEDSTRALLATLQATDLNDEFDALFRGLDPLKASVAEINALLEKASAIQQEVSAVQSAVDSAFLTPAEQLAKAFGSLSVAAPETAAQFQELVLAQDLNTASGRELAASLMSIYPAFSQIKDAVSSQAASLQQRIWQLTDDTKAIREAELAALDPANRALQERIWALEDEKTALDKQKAALQASAQAATDQVASLDALSATLHDALAGIWGDSSSASVESAQAGRARLEAALAIARASGGSVLPRSDEVSAAVSAATGAGAGAYASWQDFARDTGRTASLITQLAEITDSAKTVQQRQLDVLRAQLDGDSAYQSSSLDLMTQISTSVSDIAAGSMKMVTVPSQKTQGGGGQITIGPFPAFAAGGYHSGGVRLVGEDGPELEFTGPSRIVSARDTRGALSVFDEQTKVLVALRDDLRAGLAAVSLGVQRSAKVLGRWETDGMPEVRS